MSSKDKQIESLSQQCGALLKLLAQLKAGEITIDDVELKAGKVDDKNN